MDHARRRRRIRRLGLTTGVVLAIALSLLVLRYQRADPADRVDSVEDQAALLTTAQRQAIEDYHQHLLSEFDIDYRVVTRRELPDINRAAVALFRAFGRESRSRSGRGLLLLIDPSSDRVRLEVGYALEGTYPDAFVDYLQRRQMVPFFEHGRVADGIVATTELIVTRAQQAGDELTSPGAAWETSSGGAGAVNDARLDAGPADAARSVPGESAGDRGSQAAAAHAAPSGNVDPGGAPDETLNAYLRAMAAHDSRPGLQIYTPATRAMLESWLVTPAQMDNLVRTYRSCRPEPAIFAPDGRRSVIRYPRASRGCAPFFFELGEHGWQLDLTMMQRALRFNAGNAWHFRPGVVHPYQFAFQDWDFDRNGFPRPARD